MRKLRGVLTCIVLCSLAAPAAARAQQNRTPTLSAQDYIDIQQLYARYNHTFDLPADTTGEAWAETFTADGIFKIRGGDEGAVIGHKALAEFAGRFASGPGKGTIRHWDQSLMITPTAEGAKGTCYYFSVNPTTRPLTVSGAGVYYDDLVKTPQGWRFKVRTFKSDPAAAPPAAASAPPSR
jgi:SnoaL-like protein